MSSTLPRSFGEINVDPYRTALDMPEACERLGLSVNGTGFVLCPAHSEKTPSCKVHTDHMYCHACGFHADLIGLVQHVAGCNFLEALLWISRETGLPAPHRDPEAQARYEAVQSIAEVYAAVFADAMKDPEPALSYLEKERGISRKTTEGIVGYLPATYEPPDLEAAQKAGLYSKYDNFLFSDRVVIPIYHQGEIVSLYGRALNDDRIPKHIYPCNLDPPMPGTLWHLGECRRGEEIFVAESIIDALTPIDRGFPNTVGLFGTQGLADERMAALKRTAVEKVTVVFDTDRNGAGQKGALKAGEKLFRAGYDVRILTLSLPDGAEKTDLNSYFQDHTADDFRALEPREFFDLKLDSLPKQGTSQERYRAVKPVLELIAGLPELLWKEHTEALCARVPSLDKQKVKAEITRIHGKAEDAEAARGRFLPLAYVDKIREESPVICFDGRFYRYKAGVYSPWYSEEVDQATIALIGPETQGNHIDAVRKFLNSICFVRPEKTNPPGMLNLKNCILNPSTGDKSDHSPDFLFTTQSNTSFDPEAVCPLWLQTLAEILPDAALQALMAQIFGYCLTADNSQQVAFIFFGEGRNGKSVITDVLEELIGKDNCSALHLSDFKERFRLAELQNRLVNFSTEVEAKGLVNDARLKGIITGDPLVAERKNQPPFVFRPFVKLIVSCNNLPQTRDKSVGYFRRWIIIPFEQKFERESRDRDRAKTIIKTELSGVLNWAIGGYKSLMDAGHFADPPTCAQALRDYRSQVDPTISFIEEELVVDKGARTGLYLKDVYAKYKAWSSECNVEPLGRNNFKLAITRNTGIASAKGEQGIMFRGVFFQG